jgi:hypothetical protein
MRGIEDTICHLATSRKASEEMATENAHEGEKRENVAT